MGQADAPRGAIPGAGGEVTFDKPMGSFWICEEHLKTFGQFEDAVDHVMARTGNCWVHECVWGPDGMGSITWTMTGHEVHRGHSPAGGYYLNQVPHKDFWEAFARGVIMRAFHDS